MEQAATVTAGDLKALAGKLRRLRPDWQNPERYFEQRDELEKSALAMAGAMHKRPAKAPIIAAIAEPDPTEDWSSEEGARLLAAQIRNYWLNRGYYKIKTWVERGAMRTPSSKARGTAAVYDWHVRSNIGLSGLPAL